MTQGLGGLGNTMGEAFINFHANTLTLKREVQDSLKDIDKEANKLTKKMGENWGKQIADGIEDTLRKPEVGDVFIKSVEEAVTKSKTVANVNIKTKVNVDVDKTSIDRVGTNIVGALRNAVGRAASTDGGILGDVLGGGRRGGGGGGIGGTTANLLGGLGTGLSQLLRSIGSSIGNVGAAGPAAPIIGGVVVAGIMALVGAIAALLNVFGPLLYSVFLLPAGLGAIVAAVIPLTLAFDGLGEAAAALMSGDVEKIAETMNKLGNSGQKVAKDLAQVIPWLQEAKKNIQEIFLKPIAENNVLTFLQKALGPTIIKGLQSVAEAAGNFATNLARVAENPSIQKFLETVFMLATSLYNNTSAGFNQFLIGLADVGVATGPYLENLTKLLGEGLGDLGAWLTRISADGTLKGFLDKLSIAVDGLLRLGDSAWDLLKAVIGAAGEEGRAMEFLDTLIYTIDSLTNFFRSELGQESIKGMILLAEAFVVALALVAVAFAEIAAIVEGIRWLLEQQVGIVLDLLYFLGLYEGRSQFGEKAAKKGSKGLATGGIVTHRMDGVSLAEQGPEAVIPLNDPARAMDLMNQSGLTGLANSGSGMNFGPGSITINFTGAVPTKAEAFRTGAAVADGINSGMAQRNTRMAVRTL